jgi:CRP-like cAMP-binding protein
VAEVDLEHLRRVSVFAPLSPEQLEALVGAAERMEHAAGETLTEEGAHGHRFHLLLEGEAVVDRGGRRVATVRAGDFVGEVGLLGGGPSTATVRCTAPTVTLALQRERFWDVLEREPTIALRILEVVCRRLEREFRPDPRANLGADA